MIQNGAPQYPANPLLQALQGQQQGQMRAPPRQAMMGVGPMGNPLPMMGPGALGGSSPAGMQPRPLPPGIFGR